MRSVRFLIVRAAVKAAPTLALLVSCTDFDREDRIEDMRVLAIKTDPPEILYSPLHLTPAFQRPPGFPLPSVDVDVEVFAFDPRGGTTSLTLQMCPEGAGDNTCRLYDQEEDVLEEPAPARDDVRALLTPNVVESAIAPTSTPVGRLLPATFEYTFSANVIDFFIPDDRDGNPIPSIFPLLPRFVAIAENHDQVEPAVVRERAFKRMPVTLDLTSPDLPPNVTQDLANALGIELCEAPIPEDQFVDQERATCLERRSPNTNPLLNGFILEDDPAVLTEGVAIEGEEIGPGSLLAVDPGDLVAVTPVFEDGSVERYQVISFDIEASKIIILNRVEDLACTWYTSRGDVSDTLTAEQFNSSLGVVWQLPTNAVTGERDSLYLVVLDQRGGTAVGEVTVEYR